MFFMVLVGLGIGQKKNIPDQAQCVRFQKSQESTCPTVLKVIEWNIKYYDEWTHFIIIIGGGDRDWREIRLKMFELMRFFVICKRSDPSTVQSTLGWKTFDCHNNPDRNKSARIG